jgi:hypothetical protein
MSSPAGPGRSPGLERRLERVEKASRPARLGSKAAYELPRLAWDAVFALRLGGHPPGCRGIGRQAEERVGAHAERTGETDEGVGAWQDASAFETTVSLYGDPDPLR